MHLFLFADSTFNITTLYYKATIIRSFLLAAKGARFSCNDQASLAKVDNAHAICFKVNGGHPCYGQLTAVKKEYQQISIT